MEKRNSADFGDLCGWLQPPDGADEVGTITSLKLHRRELVDSEFQSITAAS
jgi:hypothetical protein